MVGGAARGMWRCACVLALLCAVLCRAGKRAEMSPVPFVLSSRYGRSPPRMMMPRSDRFFMGTRYGKRSDVGLAGAGAVWRACDCDHYRRSLTNPLYKRRMGAPERVPTED